MVSVLQWNILYKEKIQNIAKFLKMVSPDIACLQEVNLSRQITGYKNHLEYLAKSLGYNYHYAVSPGATKNHDTLADAILSRYPMRNQKSIYVQKPKVPSAAYDNQNRVYAEAELNIDGKQITVGTTHLSFTKWFINNAKRQLESDKLINAVKHHKRAYVLTGDLNSTPGSYTVRRIKRYLKHAGPPVDQNTFTTKPFKVDDFEENGLNWRLDYIFTTKDIRARNAEILKTNYSDHLPVRVELEI